MLRAPSAECSKTNWQRSLKSECFLPQSSDLRDDLMANLSISKICGRGQPLTSAVTMTLPALPLSTVRRLCCLSSAPADNRYLPPSRRLAANRMHAAIAVDRCISQKDGRTDAWPFHRPRSAYSAGSIKKTHNPLWPAASFFLSTHAAHYEASRPTVCNMRAERPQRCHPHFAGASHVPSRYTVGLHAGLAWIINTKTVNACEHNIDRY